MKKLFIAIAIAGFTSMSFAQEVKVIDKTESYPNVGTQKGFYVEVPFADKKTVDKEIKSLFKKWKGKYSDKEGIFIDDAKVKTVSSNTFDVYGKVIEEAGGKIAISIAVNLGGAYVDETNHPTAYRELKKMIHNIAVECSKAFVENEVKAQEKVVKEKKKEQDKLVSEKEKLEKAIKDYEQKIVEAKADIKTNEGNQEKKKTEISDEEKKLEQINNKLNSIK